MMENKTKIDLKNKSIFITGVAGFIGSNLAKRLLSTVEGVKVVGLDNINHYYDEENRKISSRAKTGTAASPEIFGERHRRTCQRIRHRAELQHD